MSDDAKAWGDFWAKNTGGKNGGPNNSTDGGGCLPDRWAAIEEAQQESWRGFVADLPQEAALLDLATGDGRVLRWMRAVRGDLALKGIDLAPELPSAPEGTETLGGIAMEKLPFEADSFDAAVSQFGFEYGDTVKVAAEMARVLKKGGKVGLMVHRGDGPILEHNAKRRAEIGWALDEKKVDALVANALQAPGGGAAIAAQVAGAISLLGANKFGENSPAWEIPEAMRRACVMGQKGEAQAILDTLAAIKVQAANEIGRINSLEKACARADAREDVIAAFATQGLDLAETREVAEPSGRPLADFLIFS